MNGEPIGVRVRMKNFRRVGQVFGLACVLTLAALFLLSYFSETSSFAKLLAVLLAPGLLVATRNFAHGSHLLFVVTLISIQLAYAAGILLLWFLRSRYRSDELITRDGD
jgi:hypothetical protein